MALYLCMSFGALHWLIGEEGLTTFVGVPVLQKSSQENERVTPNKHTILPRIILDFTKRPENANSFLGYGSLLAHYYSITIVKVEGVHTMMRTWSAAVGARSRIA